MERKTIVITGATDGLGKAIALMASKNYNLAICGRNQAKMDLVLSQLDKNADVYSECFDMNDTCAIVQFCANVRSHFNHIDVMINNAGANLKKERVENMNIDLFKEMLQVNCISHLLFIQQFYPSMKDQGEGHFINILSSCCLYNNETMAGYTASKDAMEAISKILLKEAREDNIKVTNVYPGGIDTNFRAVPKHDYLKPESVAKMVIACIEAEEGTVHELVMRPMIETNIA